MPGTCGKGVHMSWRMMWRTAALVLLLVVFNIPMTSSAHPGNTDGDGCHTCRTNCTESWGIPYDYYHRHNPVRPCHESLPVAPTTTQSPTTSTTRPPPTTTTTRAPPVDPSSGNLDSILGDLSAYVLRLSSEMSSVNEQWDERTTTFQQTRGSFEAIVDDLEAQYAALEVESIPPSHEPVLTKVQERLGELAQAARAVIQGLDAPDDGSQRREAISHWSDSVEDFEAALAPPETTTTTKLVSATSPTATNPSQTAAPEADDQTPEPVEAPATNDSTAGWIGATALLAGLAYWLGRRQKNS